MYYSSASPKHIFNSSIFFKVSDLTRYTVPGIQLYMFLKDLCLYRVSGVLEAFINTNIFLLCHSFMYFFFFSQYIFLYMYFIFLYGEPQKFWKSEFKKRLRSASPTAYGLLRVRRGNFQILLPQRQHLSGFQETICLQSIFMVNVCKSTYMYNISFVIGLIHYLV